MLKVAFCQLDARDDHYTGYNPVGFYNPEKDEHVRPETQEQAQLQIILVREYLTRLSQLQDEIAAKYELALTLLPHTPLVPESEQYAYGLSKEDYETYKQRVIELFPGHQAAYYT